LPGTVGIGEALISPLVANGFVYVPADGTVMVLGLHGTAPTTKARQH
jgi:hypothetical protein